MSDTEGMYWIGLWVVSVVVLVILLIEPTIKTYTRWQRQRAFRARDREHGYGLDRRRLI